MIACGTEVSLTVGIAMGIGAIALAWLLSYVIARLIVYIQEGPGKW